MQCQHTLLSSLSTAYTLKESQTEPLTKTICIKHTKLQTGPNRLSLFVMPLQKCTDVSLKAILQRYVWFNHDTWSHVWIYALCYEVSGYVPSIRPTKTA